MFVSVKDQPFPRNNVQPLSWACSYFSEIVPFCPVPSCPVLSCKITIIPWNNTQPYLKEYIDESNIRTLVKIEKKIEANEKANEKIEKKMDAMTGSQSALTGAFNNLGV